MKGSKHTTITQNLLPSTVYCPGVVYDYYCLSHDTGGEEGETTDETSDPRVTENGPSIVIGGSRGGYGSREDGVDEEISSEGFTQK